MRRLPWITLVLAFFMSLAAPALTLAQPTRTVVIGLDAEPENLDPRNYNFNPATFAVSWRLFEPLLIHDTRRGALIPGLAERYEPLTPARYRFDLRQGVTWHDGQPFTADDVAWTLTRTPDRIKEYLLDPANPVEIIDRYTIIVNTAGEVGPFLLQTVALNWRILPRHIYEPLYAHYRAMSDSELLQVLAAVGVAPGEGETPLERALFEVERGALWQEPTDANGNPLYIGTGPFRFRRWERGAQIVMTANDAYWGGRPHIDRLVWRWEADAAARLAALEAGDFDLILDAPESEIERLRADEDIEIIASPGLNYRALTLNLRTPALSDLRVRQAIAHAIDVDALVNLFPPGMATRTCAPLPASSPFNSDAALCYDHDPDKARALLDEAGWNPATALRLTITEGDLPEAAAIRDALAEVGVMVNLETVDRDTHRLVVTQGRAEMALYTFANVVDPDHMYWVFHGDWLGAGKAAGAGGIFGYDDPDVNAWTVQGQTTADPEARRQAYDQAQRKIAQDLPAIFLYSRAEITAYRADRLAGVTAMPRPTDVFYWLATADVIQQ